MSGILQLGYDYGNNRTAAISVDANGKLDVDVELNTSGLATSANQTNGTQQAKCMGINGGTPVQLALEANGSLVIGGGAVKTAVDNLGATQHVLVDSSGHLQVDVLSGGGGGTQFAGEATLASTGTGTAMIGRDSGNVARLVATDTSGNLQIDILANADTTKATSTLQSAGNTLLTTISGHTSSIQSNVATSSLQNTANGHLSEIEGAVETLELCVSSNEMVINNKNAKPSNLVKNSVVSSSTGNTTPILDTEGYRSIIIIGKTDNTNGSWNIEWSDASDFAGGTDIIYNTDSPGGLSAFTPLAFQSALSADGALSYIQGISIISQIPQRHMRIRVFNTSGSNRDYTFFYQLSN